MSERQIVDMNDSEFEWPVGHNPRWRVALVCEEGSSMTKQAFKEEADMNNIVQRFQETGQIPWNTSDNPQYGVAPVLDLKGALDLIKAGRQEFDELSPAVQEMFHGDSDLYLNFLSEYDANPDSFDSEIGTDLDDSAEPKKSSKTASDSTSSEPSET